MIVRVIRRRGDMQEASLITGTPSVKEDMSFSGGMFKPASLIADLIRRFAGSQLFFLLLVQAFEPTSWLRQATRTGFALLRKTEVSIDLYGDRGPFD